MTNNQINVIADYSYQATELPTSGDIPEWCVEFNVKKSGLPFASKHNSVYLVLKPGLTEQDAREIADLLNSKIKHVGYMGW